MLVQGAPQECMVRRATAREKVGREDKSAQMDLAFRWRVVLLARMSCARLCLSNLVGLCAWVIRSPSGPLLIAYAAWSGRFSIQESVTSSKASNPNQSYLCIVPNIWPINCANSAVTSRSSPLTPRLHRMRRIRSEGGDFRRSSRSSTNNPFHVPPVAHRSSTFSPNSVFPGESNDPQKPKTLLPGGKSLSSGQHVQKENLRPSDRGESAPSEFEVPADYKIETVVARGGRRKEFPSSGAAAEGGNTTHLRSRCASMNTG
jgi:hypothetical protein